MKLKDKYSVENLIDKSYELSKLIGDNNLNKEDFKNNFLNDINNRKYLDSFFNRRLKIKRSEFKIALLKEMDSLYNNKLVDEEQLNMIREAMILSFNDEDDINVKRNLIIFVINIFAVYLIALAGFGLFSYHLNIVYFKYEVFYIAAIVMVAFVIARMLKEKLKYSYLSLVPVMIIILILMIFNIYYHIFDYSYIWLFYIIFVEIMYKLVNMIFKK